MRFFQILLITAVFSLLGSCGGKSPKTTPGNCYKTIPDNLPGLKTTGTRSKKNVIKNLVPFNCTVQKKYKERLAENPALKGKITISFTVEFQGEVTNNRIRNSTVEDSVFMDEFTHIMRFMEFDPWGNADDETDVTYTMNLK